MSSVTSSSSSGTHTDSEDFLTPSPPHTHAFIVAVLLFVLFFLVLLLPSIQSKAESFVKQGPPFQAETVTDHPLGKGHAEKVTDHPVGKGHPAETVTDHPVGKGPPTAESVTDHPVGKGHRL